MFRPASDWHPESDSVTAERMMQIAVSSVAKMRFRFMANGSLCKGLARRIAPGQKPANRCGMVCRLQTIGASLGDIIGDLGHHRGI